MDGNKLFSLLYQSKASASYNLTPKGSAQLLIYSSNFKQQLEHLRTVLQRLKRHDIRGKASKYHLFKREISYLRSIISSAGYTADPKNIIAVSSKPKKKPSSITKLQSVLGLVGYFRRSILNFS